MINGQQEDNDGGLVVHKADGALYGSQDVLGSVGGVAASVEPLELASLPEFPKAYAAAMRF